MFRQAVLFLTMALFQSTGLAQSEALTNEDIIRLARAGLTEEVIAGKIESSKADFDLSVEGLVALKKAGVPDRIIEAMQRRQGAPPGSRLMADKPFNPSKDRPELEQEGVYYQGAEGWIAMEPTEVSKVGSVNFGSMLTSGLFRPKRSQQHTRTAEVEGGTAALAVSDAVPAFSIRLGREQLIGSCGLVRFDAKRDKRKIKIVVQEKDPAIVAPARKHLLPTAREKLHDRLYVVRPASALKDGEYGFWCADAESKFGLGKIYDFSVEAGAK